ncbi:MAG: hypothetical protein ABI790_05350 [Betaproteobacteria bacterium]
MNDDFHKPYTWHDWLALLAAVVTIGAVMYYGSEYLAADRTPAAVPALTAPAPKAVATPAAPAAPEKPETRVLGYPIGAPPAAGSPAPGEPAVVPGVGINPHPGVYPPGWGPCPAGTNSYGPGGAFGWGCPIGTK